MPTHDITLSSMLFMTLAVTRFGYTIFRARKKDRRFAEVKLTDEQGYPRFDLKLCVPGVPSMTAGEGGLFRVAIEHHRKVARLTQVGSDRDVVEVQLNLDVDRTQVVEVPMRPRLVSRLRALLAALVCRK